MDSRASTRKILFGENYQEEREYRSTRKLPTGQYLIGRMISLCKESAKGKSRKVISRAEASKKVGNEVIQDWVSKNVYTMTRKAVAKKLKADYDQFRNLRKVENRQNSKSDEWYEKASHFNDMMTKVGYNIRCQDLNFQKQQEEQFGVKMTADEELFYIDNCFGEYIARCSSTVPRSWKKQQLRNETRDLAAEKRKSEVQEEKQVQQDINLAELHAALGAVRDPAVTDSDFVPPSSSTISEETITKTSSADTRFPSVKIRTGYKTFNESLMRCLVKCTARYNASPNDVLGIFASLANDVFDQNWRISSAAKRESSGESGDDDDETDDETDTDEFEKTEISKKRRKSCGDLTYVMPSRKSLSRYLEDASFLNLKLLAEKLLHKGDNVVCVGIDDTTKSAGHRRFDVKTDSFSVAGPSGKMVLTSGYIPNISHSGEDAASAYKYQLQCLGVLADCSVEEIMQQIDFWMSDRASDCAKMLEELEIDKDQILKCCAHLILGIDHSIEKVFKETERKVGIEKLVNCGNILRSSGSSLHTVGLIAITKLLSPSHASHSVSLFTDFVDWMANNKIDNKGFKGFISNRFGRIAELARTFLVMKEPIMNFFEATVDISANKLVLAVSEFLSNEWFQCTNEVYTLMGQLIIFPLMELLGIDQTKKNRPKKDWQSVKSFFESKLPELERLRKRFAETATGKGHLNGEVIEEMIDCLRRQLSQMDYFRESEGIETTIDEKKLVYAPLTNMACESNFARLSNQVRISGGMAPLETLSRKAVVATNDYLSDTKFTEQSETERRSEWKWARHSDEVQKVKKMQADFLEKVKASKQLALKKKEELKKKKSLKLMKILDDCKKHGGPVTSSSIGLLNKLCEKQLLSEIVYLRMTVDQNIRQKRRVKIGDGRYRFQNFSNAELRDSIKSVIHPENKVENDVEKLLRNLYVISPRRF